MTSSQCSIADRPVPPPASDRRRAAVRRHHGASPSPVRRRGVLALLVTLATLAPGAALAVGAPTDPGDSADGAFAGRRVSGDPEGAAVRNLTTNALFASIQDAVLAASPGDTLQVEAAELLEGQVMIDRNLTLQGQTGNEVVRMAVDTGDKGDDRAWFLVDFGIVLTVRDLNFDGNGRLVHQAFRHKGDGSFTNCSFTDVQFNSSGPDYAGIAIASLEGNIHVTDCDFDQIGRVGFLAFGATVTDSVVSGMTYTGKGDGDFLDYGVEVSAGALVQVEDTRITDCRGVASVDGSTSAGIFATTFFAPGTEAVIRSSTLLDNTEGIGVGFGLDSSTVTAELNRLVGNGAGIASASSIPIAGERNWWGCNAGPGAAGCDGVAGAGPIDADPWLVLDLTVDAAGPVPAGTSVDLIGSLTSDSDGADTSALGAVQDGTPALFDGGALGTVMPATAGTVDGEAMTTWTALILGSGEVAVTVDAETVTAPVEVIEGEVTPATIEIPTLDAAGLALLVAALAGAALAALRRRGPALRPPGAG